MIKQIRKQRGGTLLGIIIGLIVGLGIALGVALMITKGSTPFKLPRQEKATDSGNGKISDPNKPLYGNKAPVAPKDGVRQAEKPVPTSQPSDNKTVVSKPEAQQAAVPAAPALEPVKTAPSKQAAKSEEDKWQYFLQAGAFRETKDAEATRAKLALIGVDAQISERQSENGTLYRVRIGPFAQLDAMNNVRSKLSSNGVEAAVVRTSR